MSSITFTPFRAELEEPRDAEYQEPPATPPHPLQLAAHQDILACMHALGAGWVQGQKTCMIQLWQVRVKMARVQGPPCIVVPVLVSLPVLSIGETLALSERTQNRRALKAASLCARCGLVSTARTLSLSSCSLCLGPVISINVDLFNYNSMVSMFGWVHNCIVLNALTKAKES